MKISVTPIYDSGWANISRAQFANYTKYNESQLANKEKEALGIWQAANPQSTVEQGVTQAEKLQAELVAQKQEQTAVAMYGEGYQDKRGEYYYISKTGTSGSIQPYPLLDNRFVQVSKEQYYNTLSDWDKKAAAEAEQMRRAKETASATLLPTVTAEQQKEFNVPTGTAVVGTGLATTTQQEKYGVAADTKVLYIPETQFAAVKKEVQTASADSAIKATGDILGWVKPIEQSKQEGISLGAMAEQPKAVVTSTWETLLPGSTVAEIKTGKLSADSGLALAPEPSGSGSVVLATTGAAKALDALQYQSQYDKVEKQAEAIAKTGASIQLGTGYDDAILSGVSKATQSNYVIPSVVRLPATDSQLEAQSFGKVLMPEIETTTIKASLPMPSTIGGKPIMSLGELEAAPVVTKTIMPVSISISQGAPTQVDNKSWYTKTLDWVEPKLSYTDSLPKALKGTWVEKSLAWTEEQQRTNPLLLVGMSPQASMNILRQLDKSDPNSVRNVLPRYTTVPIYEHVVSKAFVEDGSKLAEPYKDSNKKVMYGAMVGAGWVSDVSKGILKEAAYDPIEAIGYYYLGGALAKGAHWLGSTKYADELYAASSKTGLGKTVSLSKAWVYRNVPIALGITMTGAYAVGTGLEVKAAPTRQEKVEKLSHAGYTFGALALGGAAARKDIINIETMKLAKGTAGRVGGEQFYDLKAKFVEPPYKAKYDADYINHVIHTKQLIVAERPQPTVATMQWKGTLAEQPFSQKMVKPKPGDFSDIFISSQRGKLTYIGKISGGLTTNRVINYKVMAGDYAIYRSGNIKLSNPIYSNLRPNQLVETPMSWVKYPSRSSGGLKITNLKVAQQSQQSGMFTVGSAWQGVGNTKANININMMYGSKTSALTHYQSKPTMRTVQRLYSWEDISGSKGWFGYSPRYGQKATDIRLAKDFSSPDDIILTNQKYVALLGSQNFDKPYLKVDIMSQRGGQLIGATQIKSKTVYFGTYSGHLKTPAKGNFMQTLSGDARTVWSAAGRAGKGGVRTVKTVGQFFKGMGKKGTYQVPSKLKTHQVIKIPKGEMANRLSIASQPQESKMSAEFIEGIAPYISATRPSTTLAPIIYTGNRKVNTTSISPTVSINPNIETSIPTNKIYQIDINTVKTTNIPFIEQEQKPKPDQVLRPTLSTTSTSRTRTDTTTKTITETIVVPINTPQKPFDNTNIDITPEPPPPERYDWMLPGLSAPWLPKGVKKPGKRGTVFNPKYMPSLQALVYNIRGKKPSKYMVASGIGVRPILSSYTPKPKKAKRQGKRKKRRR